MEEPLKVIFDHQKILVQKYIDGGKQGEYPISLEEKEGQAFIRELFGYTQEEIFEAYEMLEEFENRISKEGPKVSSTDCRLHIIGFNMEVADTIAFWVELFMYLNIDEQAIAQYYAIMLEQMDMNVLLETHKNDTLQIALLFAVQILGAAGAPPNRLKMGAHNLPSYHTKMDLPDNFDAGSRISRTIVNISEHYIFQMIKHLQIARNCLKMKYWRESAGGPDIEKLQGNIMEAWLNYMVFLSANGYERSEQIQDVFLHKNNINLERIKDKW